MVQTRSKQPKPIPPLIVRTRTRSGGSIIPTATTWTTRRLSDSVIVDGPHTISCRPEKDNVESMTDSYVNAFHRRIADGQVINLPFIRTLTRATTPKDEWTYEFPVAGNPSRATVAGSDVFHFAVNPWAFPADIWLLPEPPGMKTDLALTDLATIAARANVVKADTLALVTAAELGKTVSMVTKSSVGLAKGLALLAQGKPKKAILAALGYTKPIRGTKFKKTSLTAASKWLEIRYGWLPLIYDVQGTLKALSAELKPRFTARGFANDAGFSSPSETLNIGVCEVSSSVSTNLEKRVRAYILYEVDRRSLVPQKLGVLQLPATIWELVPFSFVFDWFVDIGEWLDAITPRVGVNVLCEGYTIAKIGSRSRLVTGTTPIAPFTAVNSLTGQSDGWFGYGKKRVTRLNMTPTPRVNVKFNPKRAIDSIALLGQQFRKTHF
jgi:hypothetical protein